MEKIELKISKQPKTQRMTSIEETIQLARLQQAVSTSALYERKHNQKALKVLTVAAYILFVSMAAIILSFYYVFIWDPTSKPIAPRTNTNCDTPKKIVIPESIAIQLANSSEISAENFFKNIYRRYQEQERELLNKKQNSTLEPTIKQSDVERETINDQSSNNKIHDVNNIQNMTTTMTMTKKTTKISAKTTTVKNLEALLQAKEQQDSYVDDEDMDSDYDETDGSGANRIQINETSVVYSFDDDTDVDV